jgi:hypothetical protein
MESITNYRETDVTYSWQHETYVMIDAAEEVDHRQSVQHAKSICEYMMQMKAGEECKIEKMIK